jgi:uncharacterized membrane protein HdeD (DUF308 family)
MSSESSGVGPLSVLAPFIQEDLKKLKSAWIWFSILGAALIVLGLLALGYSSMDRDKSSVQ